MLLASTLVCGCHSMFKPSDRERRDAYAFYQDQFAGDSTRATRSTYILFSLDDESTVPQIDNDHAQVHFSFDRPVALGQGLAVGIEPDGYLLTAGHVVGTNIYVMGWFDGRIDLKPARCIYRRNEEHADAAVLKVDASLDYPVDFSGPPQTNDTVFAVVGHRNRDNNDLEIGFTAGKVVSLHVDPSGGPVQLVNTTVPLWKGDSGGPVLNRNGQLVGITTGFRYEWRFFKGTTYRFSFRPEPALIENIVREDRERRPRVAQ